MANTETRTPKIWIFVVDSRNHSDLSDLDHFDDILWGANPNTKKGDIVLMYRTRPYSDIAYVFAAISNPRLTETADLADMKYGFVQKITTEASTLTDDDIADLHRAHYTDDQIFEAIVSAAVGAGLFRLECVLNLLRH